MVEPARAAHATEPDPAITPELTHRITGLYPAQLSLPPTDLSGDLGVVRENVSRLLRRFECLGWVRVSRERVKVTDAVGLRAAAQGPKDT